MYTSSYNSLLLLCFSAVLLVQVLGSPSADAVLEPADWPAVLEGWGKFIDDAEYPLSMVTADGDTIEACFDAVLQPYGECVIVFLDQERAGLHGFVLLEILETGPARMDFRATGEYDWWLWELEHVEAADIDDDGSTDILVIAEYITGTGPEGAKPFRVNSWVSGSDFTSYLLEE